ncbi:OmpA family protein [Candidatus Poribacteria bacterium]|nr:OmpA family protein [Candidatus Poribacteria bacterium]MXY29215.1 OmpA family protein [Candidatus Poribacteria bacterium]MYK20114.1 OmpA family protein [Candidatus Poribacteria bacterium]
MSKKGILAIVAICVAVIAVIVLAALLYSNSNRFKQTQAELATTKATLQTTETAKADLERTLTETQASLAETRSELSQTQEILQNASEAARKIAAERNALQQDKNALEEEKENLRAKLTEIESELQRIRVQSQRSITAIQERFKDTVGAVLDDAGRLKLDVKGKILFETGSAILSTEGKTLLDAIAKEVLLNTDYADYAVRIEGHTDNAPIGGSEIRNWDLSTERAIAAVKYLQVHAGIKAQRLAGTGYAFYQPIDTADTPEAKAKNRRIEIILVPPQDFLSELLTSLQKVMVSIEKREAE